jgi:tellurite resistance protein TehA-like permease
MEQLTFGTLIAVWEEMFGRGLFWAMVVVAVIITALYVYVLIRDHSMSMRKFLLAQLSMPVGAVAAVAFVLTITNSSLSDMGGPIDWLVLLGIAGAGAVGFAILVYVAQSLIRGRRDAG